MNCLFLPCFLKVTSTNECSLFCCEDWLEQMFAFKIFINNNGNRYEKVQF